MVFRSPIRPSLSAISQPLVVVYPPHRTVRFRRTKLQIEGRGLDRKNKFSNTQSTTMAFPPQRREPPPTLPSISSSGPGSYRRNNHDMSFSGSPAISIPGLESQDDVPSPLPPPRYLPFLEIAARPEHSKKEPRDYGHPASPVPSGYGSMYSSLNDGRSSLKRRENVGSNNGDEGYASYTAAERCVAW